MGGRPILHRPNYLLIGDLFPWECATTAHHSNMITNSGAVDCQHEAGEIVSIKRKRLSVVGLQQSHPVPFSAPAVCHIYDDIIALWMLFGSTCAPKIPNLRVVTVNLLNDLTHLHPIDPTSAIGVFIRRIILA